jgi:hypothetical protein
VIKLAEEVRHVGVEHPAHLPVFDPYRQRIQRIVLVAPWSEPVREAEEVRLVDVVQHPDNGTLGDLILQAYDAERPLPPVCLWDIPPPRWLRSVRSAVQPLVQVLETRLQVLPVGLPRLAVYSRSRLGAYPPVGVPQSVDGDVVQECSEPYLPVPFGQLTHTVQLM